MRVRRDVACLYAFIIAVILSLVGLTLFYYWVFTNLLGAREGVSTAFNSFYYASVTMIVIGSIIKPDD